MSIDATAARWQDLRGDDAPAWPPSDAVTAAEATGEADVATCPGCASVATGGAWCEACDPPASAEARHEALHAALTEAAGTDAERWADAEAAALVALDDLRAAVRRPVRSVGKRRAAAISGLSVGTCQRWAVEGPPAAAMLRDARARRDRHGGGAGSPPGGP